MAEISRPGLPVDGGDQQARKDQSPARHDDNCQNFSTTVKVGFREPCTLPESRQQDDRLLSKMHGLLTLCHDFGKFRHGLTKTADYNKDSQFILLVIIVQQGGGETESWR